MSYTSAELAKLEARLEFFRLPLPWILGYAKITDKYGRTISLVPNYLQKQVLEIVVYCIEHDIPCRIIVLKPRQTGCSTIVKTISYWYARSRRVRQLTVGDTHQTLDFQHQIWDTLSNEDTFDWGNRLENGARVIRCSNGSRLFRSSAESRNPGIGGTFQMIHTTETAKFPEGGVVDANVFMPKMTAALAKKSGTISIDESTPEGVGNFFEKRYNGDPDADEAYLRAGAVTFDEFRNGETGNGYIRVYSPWFEFDDYQEPLTTQKEFDAIMASLTRGELSLLKRLGTDKITADRLKWRRATIAGECKGREDLFIQEYTEDELAAFLLSGGGRFDEAGIAYITDRARNPEWAERRQIGRIRVGDKKDWRSAKWTDTGREEAEAIVWEMPIPGCKYIVTVDTMLGKELVKDSGKRDRNSIQVWREAYFDNDRVYHKRMLVARAKPDNQDDPTPGAALAAGLAKFYGDCFVAFELNNTGAAWVQPLKDQRAVIWRRVEEDTLSGKKMKKIGFVTGEKTREALVEALADDIRSIEEAADIPCQSLAGQLRTFVRNSDGKAEGQGSSHDDDVIAAGMAHFLLNKGHGRTMKPPPKA